MERIEGKIVGRDEDKLVELGGFRRHDREEMQEQCVLHKLST